jgi:hypothetical protein
MYGRIAFSYEMLPKHPSPMAMPKPVSERVRLTGHGWQGRGGMRERIGIEMVGLGRMRQPHTRASYLGHGMG